MKFESKKLAKAYLVFAFAVCLGVSLGAMKSTKYFLPKGAVAPAPSSPVVTMTPEPEPEITPVVKTSTDFSKWLTYRNEDYGFKFKYDPIWGIGLGGQGYLISGDQMKESLIKTYSLNNNFDTNLLNIDTKVPYDPGYERNFIYNFKIEDRDILNKINDYYLQNSQEFKKPDPDLLDVGSYSPEIWDEGYKAFISATDKYTQFKKGNTYGYRTKLKKGGSDWLMTEAFTLEDENNDYVFTLSLVTFKDGKSYAISFDDSTVGSADKCWVREAGYDYDLPIFMETKENGSGTQPVFSIRSKDAFDDFMEKCDEYGYWKYALDDLVQLATSLKFFEKGKMDDWLTYKDGEHGFEFKYPDNFAPDPANSDSVSFSTGNSNIDDIYAYGYKGVAIQIVKSKLDIENIGGSYNGWEEPNIILIDGVKSYLTTGAEGPCGVGDYQIPRDKYYIKFTDIECIGSESTLIADDYFSRILSTFKFTQKQ